MIRRLAYSALALVISASIGIAGEPRLAPYKNKLFANPKPFKTLHDGALEMVEYSVQRDYTDRDEVPAKKANAKYVSVIPDKAEHDLTFDDGNATTNALAVGNVKNPRVVVIFLHGRGAGRGAGFDDWNFGGNFNRIKNLMVRNRGVYVSPSFSNFHKGGKNQIKAVMKSFAEKSPGVPIFVACASAGGALCVALAEDPESAKLLGGVLFLGASVKRVESSVRVFTGTERRIPIYIGHGNKDEIVNWVKQEFFLKAVKAEVPDYPIRYRLFVPGLHGTPMRMTDWRSVINWMLSLYER